MRNHRRSSSGGDGHGQRRRMDTSWEHLPWDLQARILCLLAVTDLLRLLAVSRSFLNLIRSPSFVALLSASPVRPRDQIIFLFTEYQDGNHSRRALCFHPSTSRFFFLPIFRCLNRPTISCHDDQAFSYATSSLSRLLSRSPPRPVTPRVPCNFAVVAVLPNFSDDDHFFLLAVGHMESYPNSSALYDSRERKWSPAGGLDNVRWPLPPPGSVCSPCIGDRVFLLARPPHGVVVFHAHAREWEMLPTPMPDKLYHATACLFSWDGGLFLVGGTPAAGAVDLVSGILVWKLDWEAMEWREFWSVPDAIFHGLLKTARPNSFGFIYGNGILMVCFPFHRDALLLHLSTMECCKVPDCDLIPKERKLFFGLVATPAIDLLMPSSASEQEAASEYECACKRI